MDIGFDQVQLEVPLANQKLTFQDCLLGFLFLMVYELITWTLVAAVILALLYVVSLICQ